jgi:hypothetical protein
VEVLTQQESFHIADGIADKSKLIGYSWTPEQQEGEIENA